MTHRIHIVRHGPSSHVHRGWLTSGGFENWRAAYEAAGIVEEAPPAQLLRTVEAASIVISSPAPRATESAQRLVSGEIVISSLLREMRLSAPEGVPVSLPLFGWALVVGLGNAVQRMFGRYPSAEESARVEAAAKWLIELAAVHSEIAVVSHASLRSELVKHLSRQGWQLVTPRRSLRHWSCWTLERPGGSRPNP